MKKKIVLLLTTASAVVSLTGCGVINTALTKPVETCDNVMNKSIANAEKELGSASQIKNRPDGTQERQYRNGYSTTILEVKDGKVISAECSKSQSWGIF